MGIKNAKKELTSAAGSGWSSAQDCLVASRADDSAPASVSVGPLGIDRSTHSCEMEALASHWLSATVLAASSATLALARPLEAGSASACPCPLVRGPSPASISVAASFAIVGSETASAAGFASSSA